MILINALIDLLFPPLCFHCGAKLGHSQLCEHCWEASRLIDPKFRCIHCFEVSEVSLCLRCTKDPELPYPRAAVFERDAPILRMKGEEEAEAFAGFAYHQLEQLNQPEPDFLVSVVASPIAKALATLCQKPSPNLFRRKTPFGSPERWELRAGLIPEDAVICLFDPGAKRQALEFACAAIAEAFPKKVYILSLAF